MLIYAYKFIRETVKELQQLIRIPSTTGNVEAPEKRSDLTIPPSLEELDSNDYDDVAYWSHDDWKDFKKKAELRNRSYDKLDFICDEDGKPVDYARLGEITTYARELWVDLYTHRRDPQTWGVRGKEAREYFSNSMRARFSELRYCSGDWKVNEFAKVRYPDWSKDIRNGGKLSSEPYSTPSLALYSIQFPGAMPSIISAGSKRKADDAGLEKSRKKKKRKNPQENPPAEADIINISGDDSEHEHNAGPTQPVQATAASSTNKSTSSTTRSEDDEPVQQQPTTNTSINNATRPQPTTTISHNKAHAPTQQQPTPTASTNHAPRPQPRPITNTSRHEGDTPTRHPLPTTSTNNNEQPQPCPTSSAHPGPAMASLSTLPPRQRRQESAAVRNPSPEQANEEGALGQAAEKENQASHLQPRFFIHLWSKPLAERQHSPTYSSGQLWIWRHNGNNPLTEIWATWWSSSSKPSGMLLFCTVCCRLSD